MENTTNVVNSRRNFLKKAAYSAPAIIALGALSAPVSAQASTFVAKTQSDPATVPVSYSAIATIDGSSGPGVVTSGTYTGSNNVLHYYNTRAEVVAANNDFGFFQWAADDYGFDLN